MEVEVREGVNCNSTTNSQAAGQEALCKTSCFYPKWMSRWLVFQTAYTMMSQKAVKTQILFSSSSKRRRGGQLKCTQ